MGKSLAATLRLGKQVRVMGIDDAPFAKTRGSLVNIAGVVCSQCRFEGMVWGEAEKDGRDATDQLISLITNSKFHPQLHAVLLDGIAIGGFNIIDLPRLHEAVSLPCIAVMRKLPDLPAIHRALLHFEDVDDRLALLARAGEIHQQQGFVFQVVGCEPALAAELLANVTDEGLVPEALRLAHLIGAAVKTGESSRRA